MKLLQNKIVLYVIIFLSVANILGYAVLGNVTGIILFLVMGGLNSLFEKNMTVILLVPLIVTSLFMMGKTVKEGIDNMKNRAHSKKDNAKGTTATGTTATGTTATGTTAKGTTATGTTGSNIIHPLDNTSAEEQSDTEPQGSEPLKDGFKKRNRIDYASTIEDAYGNLSEILGSDGIKGLTDDTQKLMKQQLQLAEAMKSMTPIVEQAQNMLQGLDIKNLGGLADLAKQFTSGKKMQ